MKKGLSAQEKRDALKGLMPDDEHPDLPLIDRTNAENWATCPWMGKECEQGRGGPVGLLAESGEAIHQCLSAVTQAWIDSNGAHTAADLRNDLEIEMRRVRPDLQPDVINGLKPSIWAWANFISGGYQGRMIHPHNIMRFDGGEGFRSGQLAWEIPDLGVCLTSEIDLLLATASIEVVENVDYKSGHKPWWCDDVADAFQFQVHATLILHNYPDVNAVRTRVWCTRLNRVTHTVVFPRNRLHDYEVRIRSALEARRTHYDNPPTWPMPEKCGQCQVAARCPVATYPISAEPVDVLRDLIAVEARADALRQVLKAHVSKTKQDVRCGQVWFGKFQKPASQPKFSIYETKGASNGDSDSNEAT